MRNLITLFVAVAAGTTVSFATAETPITNNVVRTTNAYERTGGMVVKPGSLQGFVEIYNGQTKVSNAELRDAVDRLIKVLCINIVLKSGPVVSVNDALNVRLAEKASAIVYIVDNPELPASLVAVEERWGFVNVAKLEVGADKVLRFGRTRTEMLRVFALVCGSAGSQFPGNALSAGDKPSDLDGVDPGIPIDALNRMMHTLRGIGVTKAERRTYRRACKEGWAPKPVDEVQRKIWEEYHSIPTEPIKIKFDPNKGI